MAALLPTYSRSSARLKLRSERELAHMRWAGLVVWQAHQLAAPRVQPGVTTRELDATIDDFFARCGAQALFKGVPGAYPFPAATCISVNDQVVHGIPGDRVLQSGDIVSIDTGCKYNGWCGDAAYTWPVGPIPPDVQKLLDATREVLDLAISEMQLRSLWSDVAEAMERFVRERGFAMVEDMVGHGVGREMHEDPQVPHYCSPTFRQEGDFPLKPGLVIAIEPMVNMGTKRLRVEPDKWTHATADGRWSAHFEHTVAMTRSGPRVLTAPPENDEEWAFVRRLGTPQ